MMSSSDPGAPHRAGIHPGREAEGLSRGCSWLMLARIRVIVRGRDREGEFSKDYPQTMCRIVGSRASV